MSKLIRRGVTAILLVLLCAAATTAQTPQPPAAPAPPAPPAAPSPDTPTIKLGVLLFADYTYQSSPQVKDADGNSVSPNAFNITRAYLNVTGTINHAISFRITPDAVRETGAGSSLNGSYTLRLKYALAQFGLDDWMPKGTWVRLGMLPTPYLEHLDPIYRYRFQGLNFAESSVAGSALSSADSGAAFRTTLGSDYGDVVVGLFNGEGYTGNEVNDQKAIQIRGSVRPLPHAQALHGLQVTGFYDGDHYLKNGDKQRAIGEVTFQHRFLDAGFTYLSKKDRTTAAHDAVTGNGFSIFVTPRTTKGWEGLFRYDRFTPNTLVTSQRRTQTVGGVAYWFPHQGGVSSALLLDYTALTNDGFTPAIPATHRIAVHAMVSY